VLQGTPQLRKHPVYVNSYFLFKKTDEMDTLLPFPSILPCALQFPFQSKQNFNESSEFSMCSKEQRTQRKIEIPSFKILFINDT
jgi:hypothetical protein